jgi:hypothetical protein
MRLRGIAVIVILAGSSARGPAQTLSLASLTVPDKNLASGCRLKPLVPATTAVVRDDRVVVAARPASSFPFPSNPWSGTDGRLVVTARSMVDGSLQLPDAPPPSREEASAIENRWVENVVEAYRAEYLSAEQVVISVTAIRFNDAKLAMTKPASATLHMTGGRVDRLIVGAAVVVVQAGAKTNCFDAVDTYIRGMR